MQWLDAKLFQPGLLGQAGGTWQGEASAHCPLHDATARWFVTASPCWKPGVMSFLPGCSRASVGPVEGAPQLHSTLACGSGNPQYGVSWRCSSWVFHMVLSLPQVTQFQPWNYLYGEEQATFFSATCISQRASVVKSAFPLPHHPVRKIKALWCVTPVGFVTRRETLFIRDPLSDCRCGLWLRMSKEMISSASFLISNPVSPCADTWFVINECLSLGAVRERVGTVTPVKAVVPGMSAQRFPPAKQLDK